MCAAYCFCVHRYSPRFGEDERKEGKEKLTGTQLLVATFRHMKKKNQILIIPLTFWSGVEQGFFGADFTAVRDNNINDCFTFNCFPFRVL